eukprot:scaffold2201_cov240-Pinguiococcus_pyrenoidosus.AAC.5
MKRRGRVGARALEAAVSAREGQPDPMRRAGIFPPEAHQISLVPREGWGQAWASSPPIAHHVRQVDVKAVDQLGDNEVVGADVLHARRYFVMGALALRNPLIRHHLDPHDGAQPGHKAEPPTAQLGSKRAIHPGIRGGNRAFILHAEGLGLLVKHSKDLVVGGPVAQDVAHREHQHALARVR